MMRILGLFAVVLLLNSCDGGNKPAEQTQVQKNVVPVPPTSGLEQAGTEQLIAVLSRYYILKDALVASNEAEAAKAATELGTATDSLRRYFAAKKELAPDIHTELDTISSCAARIAAAKDSIIDRQRLAFEPVSNNMFQLLRKTGLRNAGVYQQHCPMAFNDRGANWLSNTDEIRNPYFGKKMLECGEVTDSLK